jgi:hypothetical protein
VLSDAQMNEFAERGYIVVPHVVPGGMLGKAAHRISEITAADPPAEDKRGAYFYFVESKEEPALIAPLTGSPAFRLAEDLAGRDALEVPSQVQVALNIPPYSHRPGRPHIDAASAKPADGPVHGTFTMLAGILMTDQLTENSGNRMLRLGPIDSYRYMSRVNVYAAQPSPVRAVDPCPACAGSRSGSVALRL